MNIRLILISRDENSQAVSDLLVHIEDRINSSLSGEPPTSLEQLNLVLSSVSDDAAENLQFAANLDGRRRQAGIDTYGIVVPMAEAKFAKASADDVVKGFIQSASDKLASAALPPDFPTKVVEDALYGWS
jgi:hypothetical protein